MLEDGKTVASDIVVLYQLLMLGLPIRTEQESGDERRPSGPRSIGEFHLLVAEILRETFTRAAAAEGLTFAEGRALRLIGFDATQQQLTEILGVDKSRVSTIFGRLETLGLIERRKDHGDRRVRLIELTAKGVAAVKRIGIYLDANSPIMQRLDEHERRVYYGLLRKMAHPR